MKVIGLGKQGIEEGKVYEVSEQVGEVLIEQGLAYKEGEEKPKEETPKKTRKRTTK